MQRRALTIRGTVQGVGFRPFVYNLARELGLSGLVRNDGGVVVIEAEGEAAALDAFVERLQADAPPLARIDEVACNTAPVRGDGQFVIEASGEGAGRDVHISPDVATCDACLAELFDPNDPRYRYPFINCTNCGPRLTIVRGAPYDRARTTMAGFPMCDFCRRQYEDPTDRRFHAQPVACPRCGPKLIALDENGEQSEGEAALGLFVEAIREGKIGALKGLGGYHLVCEAGNEAAVSELRRRKVREEKPFAVMVSSADAAARVCEVGPVERALLESPQRPIVLLYKKDTGAGSGGDSGGIAEAVAPGNPLLGVMLAYTPVHHLLTDAVGGAALVMTSGNRSDEPIAYEDDEARQRLGDIADVFLANDRPIHVRCDDSVTRVVGGVELPLRRSRGYAPQAVKLAQPCAKPVLAVGGQLKNTFALARGASAFLSQHMGDLDHVEAFAAFKRDVGLYEQLLAIRPEVIVCDLHPDYASTHYAQRRAAEEGLPLLAVQHHHAHLAACMAEHGLTGPVIGVSFDGTGYGTDGAVWGGEFLVGDCREFRRAGRLRYVGMAGGEAAIREPWRMAAAHLRDAGLGADTLRGRVEDGALEMIGQMLVKKVNTPMTSSVGRLFDAAAALLGVRDRVTYEGQAAIELEWLASGAAAGAAYPFELTEGDGEVSWVVDTRPIIGGLAADVEQRVSPAVAARRFHATVAAIIVEVCRRLREETGLQRVTLSGGVFCNALLTEEVGALLQGEGFGVYRHRLVPPGDGGLSLGQVAVAAAAALE